jgi:MerR family transcriptional regulator, redox-sensitive transcriptional activator SoxR
MLFFSAFFSAALLSRVLPSSRVLLWSAPSSVHYEVGFKSRGERDQLREALTIGAVARRAGIQSSAMRYYERIQILPPPQRINGRRRYDPGVLRRLAVLQLAQEAGLSMSQIRLLFNNPEGDAALATRWQAHTHQKLAEVAALIAQAHHMKRMLEESLRCGCLNLDDCIDCLLNQVSGKRQP